MKKIIFISISVLLVLLLSLGYFFVYTTRGSRFLADQMIAKYLGRGDVTAENIGGNLASGLTFKNLEITNVKNLPEGTILRIQKLFLHLTSMSLNGLIVDSKNIRLKLPNSDPIVISGSFEEQQLDLNIFSKGFTVDEVLSYLPDLKDLIPMTGHVNQIDLFITGYYLEPTVKGSFVIDQFVYEGFLLTNAMMTVDIQLKDLEKDIQLYGRVYLQKGELETKRVLVNLGEGNLNFLGPWDHPQINFKGDAKVERTKISIDLKGTIEEPELTLSSDPSYSQQKLMIMLATGKSWQSVEDSMGEGLDAGALAKDFVDYFFFAGKSNQFAERFGVSEFTVQFDEDKKGIGIKKEISDSLEVGYGVEQSNEEGQAENTTQKLEGKLQVNDEVSVGVEREMSGEETVEDADKVMIKYKTSF